MAALGQKVELFVADMAVAVDFYTRVLGFEAHETRRAELAGRTLVHTAVQSGPVVIGLGLLDRLADGHHLRRAPAAPNGIGFEFVIYVAGAELEAWYERACRESTLRIEPLGLKPWGARDFRVVDPDGYYIRISEPDADSAREAAGAT
ncbi:MAG: VOC family protein [Rhizomicrobium sp.]